MAAAPEKIAELVQAAKRGELEVLGGLLDGGVPIDSLSTEGATALCHSLEYGRKEVLTFLLERGASTTVGKPPMLVASLMNHCDLGSELVKLLAEHNAAVEVKDETGTTPLMNAIGRGFLNTIKAIIELDPDVNAVNSSGDTALLRATKNSVFGNPPFPEVVKALLDRGANREVVNQDGETPVQQADRLGFQDVVSLLRD